MTKGNQTTPSFIYMNPWTLEIDPFIGGCPGASILFFTISCLLSRLRSLTRCPEMTQMHIIHNVSPCCLSPLEQLTMFSRGIWAGRAKVHLEVDEVPEEATLNEDQEVSGATACRACLHRCLVDFPRYVLYTITHAGESCRRRGNLILNRITWPDDR